MVKSSRMQEIPVRGRTGLDARVANPYLAAMTSRLFLTLLALFTGLSVQSAQVQARENSARTAEIGAVVTVEAATTVGVSCAAGVVREHVTAYDADADAALRSCRSSLVLAPPVLTGIDRARE